MAEITVRLLGALMILSAFTGGTPALADTPPFPKMMESVQGNYRTAAFYCRIRSEAVASREIAQMAAKWKVIAESQRDEPPASHARGWPEAVTAVQDALDKASKLLDQGEPRKAYDSLQEYASALSELRRQNGLYNFTDRVRDFDSQRQRWLDYRAFDDPLTDEAYLVIRETLAVMDYILHGMDRHAPPGHLADPTFPEALDGLRQSLALMRRNLDNRNERGIKGSIRDINSSFFLLFLKFG